MVCVSVTKYLVLLCVFFLAAPLNFIINNNNNNNYGFIEKVSAKVSKGTARLNSIDVEVYLNKFSFSPGRAGSISGAFHVEENSKSSSYYDKHQGI